MDPISQAALGAVVAQTTAQHKLGFKVVIAGAIAGAMPDIDVFFSLGRGYFNQLELHRGLTHSLLFALISGPIIGYLLWKREPPGKRKKIHQQRLRYWMLAMTLAVLSHPLLDLLTPYGTQLLAPFSDRRFAIFAMPIIDPLYTLSLIFGLLLAWYYKNSARVQQIGIATMMVSCTYLFCGWYLGNAATQEAERQLRAQGIENAEITSFPTILQLHYRRVVARTETQDRVGYISMWHPCEIEWGVAPREPEGNFSALQNLEKVGIFEWFTMGWIHKQSISVDGITRYKMYDLRYGTTSNPLESIFAIKIKPVDTLNKSKLEESYKVSVSGSDRDPKKLLGGLLAQAYPDSCKVNLS